MSVCAVSRIGHLVTKGIHLLNDPNMTASGNTIMLPSIHLRPQTSFSHCSGFVYVHFKAVYQIQRVFSNLGFSVYARNKNARVIGIYYKLDKCILTEILVLHGLFQCPLLWGFPFLVAITPQLSLLKLGHPLPVYISRLFARSTLSTAYISAGITRMHYFSLLSIKLASKPTHCRCLF